MEAEAPNTAEQELTTMAQTGRLTEYLRTNPERAGAALYGVVSSVVYESLTRDVERKRGHHRCAVSINHLEPDCHDRHQDDVAAVRADLLRHGTEPIKNLRGWLVSRVRPVTIDAHRRRRGEIGALQRPRLPRWLAGRLGDDVWLAELAVEIMVWVGVPVAPRDGVWPLHAWADRRAALIGRPGPAEDETAIDVERVLVAMRTNPTWYAKYIERPLGHKQAPVTATPQGDERGPRLLSLVQPHEITDARLAELASEAITAIEARALRGDDLRTAITEVVGVLFGDDPSLDADVARSLTNPAAVDRIATTLMNIIDAEAVRQR